MPLLSHAVLTDPDFVVPSVSDVPSGGVAWLRASVARFSNGDTHRRRHALAVAELAAVDPDALRLRASRGADGPVEVLAEALGLPVGVAGDVAVVAKSYQPHTTI